VKAVSREDIREGVCALGASRGDVAMVHSSLSAFGHVDGGADAVIDGLLDALGPEGTLVMPTFTWGQFHAEERVVFDVSRTPCETGRIPETFRTRSGVVRSVHVCHSVAAVGPRAGEVMGEGVSSFGPGSTFDALQRLDAWIVMLGVSFQSCTALHAVEEAVQVPYRAHRDFRGSVVILPNGTQIASASIEYLRRHGGQNDFAKMAAVLAGKGVLRVGRIGEARCMATRMRDLFRIARPMLEKDPGFLTRTRSG